MRVGSLFAGIGGVDLGFERAGHEIVWQSEIDKHASSVIARHWPDIPNHGDITQMKGQDLGAIDVLVGGFPCQDLSVAGKRAGLAGSRSGLFYEYARLIEECQPSYVVIENVPGLLSSNRGRDMGIVVGTLADLGYDVEWRTLDAQFFGVPQRRRRVFIVGRARSLGGPEVLLDSEGMRWDPPTRREEGQVVAPAAVVSTLQGGGQRGYRIDAESAAGGHLIPTHSVSPCLQERGGKGVDSDMTQAHDVRLAYGLSENQRAEVLLSEEMVRQITTGGGKPGQGYPAVAYSITPESGQGADLRAVEIDVSPTINANSEARKTDRGVRVVYDLAVRRLTPVECERLQGFPDDWTAEQADSHRYRQLGNAVCVNVAQWIGQRIMDHA